MRICKNFRFLIAWILAVGVMMSCAMSQHMAEALQSNCQPTTFTLYGETDTVWQASVNVGTQYAVTVSTDEVQHPISQVRIEVLENQNVITQNEIDWTSPTARVVFIPAQDAEIEIRVSSRIGEYQRDLGRHEIVFCAR